tara:strand:+ start:4422 stop:5033 length:612 start_codon:yes stop_codon:yes gene_type:complete
MDKQKTVNSVAHNDDFSKALMESYTRWTGGDGFQNSTIKEEEIPTGQKQGGTAFATFDTPIGTVPAPASDASTSIPTIEKQKPDDGSTKDPKATSNGGEPAVALKGSMTMGQGSMSGGVPQTNGQAIKYTNVVSKEEAQGKEAALWDEASKILTELSELTQTTYTVTGEKWETEEKTVVEEEKGCDDKDRKLKKAKKIMGYVK